MHGVQRLGVNSLGNHGREVTRGLRVLVSAVDTDVVASRDGRDVGVLVVSDEAYANVTRVLVGVAKREGGYLTDVDTLPPLLLPVGRFERDTFVLVGKSRFRIALRYVAVQVALPVVWVVVWIVVFYGHCRCNLCTTRHNVERWYIHAVGDYASIAIAIMIDQRRVVVKAPIIVAERQDVGLYTEVPLAVRCIIVITSIRRFESVINCVGIVLHLAAKTIYGRDLRLIDGVLRVSYVNHLIHESARDVIGVVLAASIIVQSGQCRGKKTEHHSIKVDLAQCHGIKDKASLRENAFGRRLVCAVHAGA